MAQDLRLTDNGVRAHVATLERDGLVADVGAERDTGGKPARLYGITREGEELFPKAYALVLGGLVDEIAAAHGPAEARALLQAVGRRVGEGVRTPADPAGRVAAGAQALRDLGGDLDVRRSGKGWQLQGYGCPLSGVTAEHAEVCQLARALLEEITGQRVTECCERGDRPRCAFRIEPRARRQ
jgi:predicted ArsR family transcriptional regulator